MNEKDHAIDADGPAIVAAMGVGGDLAPRRPKAGARTGPADTHRGDDPYVFVREFYRQRRRDQIYDGNPPIDKSIEQLLFEDEPPGPP